MATESWVEFNGVEFINHARTVALAEALALDSVWIDPEKVDWIAEALDETGYDDVGTAPWYDPGYPASAEFAGFVSLGLPGLDDSTYSATTTEYVTDGGRSGRARNSTLSIVGSLAIVASTERGAEFGKRYLDRLLRGRSGSMCTGTTMRFFRWSGLGAPTARRRNVRLTRGAAVTRKRNTDCSATWIVSFTLTCDDPYLYGEEEPQVTNQGDNIPTGPGVASYGNLDIVEQACPVYDYTPIYDPDHPALVAAPTSPDFYPDGWTVEAGDVFNRYWVRLNPVEPSNLLLVPVVKITCVEDTRMVRVSIWPNDSENDDQCDPLFTAMLTYLPADQPFYIDGMAQACYVWDGFSAAVRRTDSLVYGTDATPLQWTSFNDPDGLLVTLDVFDPDAPVLMDLALVSKSD